jgi:hypothetical protein
MSVVHGDSIRLVFLPYPQLLKIMIQGAKTHHCSDSDNAGFFDSLVTLFC